MISVVIPAYNAEETIGHAIETVAAQESVELECIVVDDGSTDQTWQTAVALGKEKGWEWLKVYRRGHLGRSAARNYGANVAQGEWVAFLDADDLWVPCKLRRQVDALQAGRADFCSCWMFNGSTVWRGLYPPRHWGYYEEYGDHLVLLYRFLYQDALWGRTLNPPSTWVMRKKVFAQLGGFDEALTGVEDWDLAVRLGQYGAHCFSLPQPLVLYALRARSRLAKWREWNWEAGATRILDKAGAPPVSRSRAFVHVIGAMIAADAQEWKEVKKKVLLAEDACPEMFWLKGETGFSAPGILYAGRDFAGLVAAASCHILDVGPMESERWRFVESVFDTLPERFVSLRAEALGRLEDG